MGHLTQLTLLRTLELFSILALSFSTNLVLAKTLKGQIIALEVPLFAEKNINSPVIQYVRKGDFIYLHMHNKKGGAPDDNEEMDANTFLQMQNSNHLSQPFDNLAMNQEFYVTMDNLGKTAYVQKKYVKVLYNDSRENEDEFTSADNTLDDTDYRLKDPLPLNYPLPSMTGYRSFITFGVGTSTKEAYPYPTNSVNQNYGNRFEIFGTMLLHSKLTDNEKNRYNKRFYFGGMFLYTDHQNQYEISDYRTSTEEKVMIGVGPCLSYDVYQTLKNRIAVFGGGLFNYTRIKVVQVKVEQLIGSNKTIQAARRFRAFNLSSRLGMLYQKVALFPEVDFILGATIDVFAPYTLKPNNPSYTLGLWNPQDSDKIVNTIDYQASLIVGLQSSF